jgi:hypothetical protein
MTRKAAAQTQHTPGAARTETEDRTGRALRPANTTTGDADSVPGLPEPITFGVPLATEACVSAARAAWLETVRALARGTAQRDHDAALRKMQVNEDKTEERG